MKRPAFFVSRLFSFFTDTLVILCITFVLNEILRSSGIYYPWVIFFSTSITYYTIFYIIYRKTPGKILTGLKITSVQETAGVKFLSMILVREIVGKYFLGFFIWVIFLRKINLSVPAVMLYGGFLIIVICCLFFYKRTWYEQLSGTKTIKHTSRKKSLNFTLIIVLLLLMITSATYLSSFSYLNGNPISSKFRPYPHTHELKEYTGFIKTKKQKPKDYIFSLFEKFDIVVLCERIHPEYTQYNLIMDILEDERFIQRAGNLFTERGSISFQDQLDTLLSVKYVSEDSLNAATAHLLRGSCPVWGWNFNTSQFNMLKKIIDINSELPDSNKIHMYFSDLSVDWNGMTPEKYHSADFKKRDMLMAENISNRMADLTKKGKKNKALVIMNARHAMGPTGNMNENTAAILKEKFPGKVANILINTVSMKFGTLYTPVLGGKWDRAFELAGNPQCGFDFKNSPFGKDRFDYLISSHQNPGIRYQDVFTGFLFYNPLNEHIAKNYYPFFMDSVFAGIMIQRCKCISPEKTAGYEEVIERCLRSENAEEEHKINYAGINVLFFTIFFVVMAAGVMTTIFLFIKQRRITNRA